MTALVRERLALRGERYVGQRQIRRADQPPLLRGRARGRIYVNRKRRERRLGACSRARWLPIPLQGSGRRRNRRRPPGRSGAWAPNQATAGPPPASGKRQKDYWGVGRRRPLRDRESRAKQ